MILLLFCQCSSKEDRARKILTSDVFDINMQCPIKLDNNIRLDSCKLLPNNDLSYYYTYMDTVAIDSVWFRKMIVEEVFLTVKFDPKMADIRSYGIYLYYTYNYPQGHEAYSFSIAPEDYL